MPTERWWLCSGIEGRVNAAIELEALWNDLSLRVPFSLFCSYPASAVTGAEDAELFSQVCCSHTAVVRGPPQIRSTQRFDASAEAPRASRHFVMQTLEALEGTLLIDDVGLVVTELATNAIVHAHSPFTVTVGSSGGAVRIEVGDSSMILPSMQTPSPYAIGNRGLALIDALTSAWGVLPTNDGKIVWAHLTRAAAA